jgi:hypothetical protein
MFLFMVMGHILATPTVFTRRQWFITIGFRATAGSFIILFTGYWFGTVIATAGYNRQPLIF